VTARLRGITDFGNSQARRNDSSGRPPFLSRLEISFKRRDRYRKRSDGDARRVDVEWRKQTVGSLARQPSPPAGREITPAFESMLHSVFANTRQGRSSVLLLFFHSNAFAIRRVKAFLAGSQITILHQPPLARHCHAGNEKQKLFQSFAGHLCRCGNAGHDRFSTCCGQSWARQTPRIHALPDGEQDPLDALRRNFPSGHVVSGPPPVHEINPIVGNFRQIIRSG